MCGEKIPLISTREGGPPSALAEFMKEEGTKRTEGSETEWEEEEIKIEQRNNIQDTKILIKQQ